MKKMIFLLLVFSLIHNGSFNVNVYADDNKQTAEETTALNSLNEAVNDTIQVFLERGQDNQMIDIAWKDYQQVNDFTFLDVVTKKTEGVTTFQEVLDKFQLSLDDVEVASEVAEGEQAIGVISYTYKAEKGDLHPERLIEDWSRIEFYFIGEHLVFAGISTMSFDLSNDKAVVVKELTRLFDDSQPVTALLALDKLEINGLGQMLSNGKFYYGYGFPTESPTDPLPSIAVISIVDDLLKAGQLMAADIVIEYSYVGAIFLGMRRLVPNEYFNVNE